MSSTTLSKFSGNYLQKIVSDNRPQFVSGEFGQFMKQNGVKHIKCSPYHPSSNGQAERFVCTFKQAILAGEREGAPLDQRLQNFLLMYRVTPHATTGVSPGKLFLGRDLRTRLDLLGPQLNTQVCNKQAAQKEPHDNRAKTREFCVGQEVMARNFRPGTKYLPGVVVQKLGPLSYLVEMKDSVVWRRHVDHLKPLLENSSPGTRSASQAQPDIVVEDDVYLPFAGNPAAAQPNQPPDPQQQQQQQQRQYPKRVRNRPTWYGCAVTH